MKQKLELPTQDVQELTFPCYMRKKTGGLYLMTGIGSDQYMTGTCLEPNFEDAIDEDKVGEYWDRWSLKDFTVIHGTTVLTITQ